MTAPQFNPYWRIFAEEVPSDLGVQMTPEQVDGLTRALEGAHENYGPCSGRDVADANWRAANEREMEKRGAERVMRFIEARLQLLDSGPSKVFNAMSHEQRMALAEIFQVRKLCR